jgi:hypothetical protein
VNHTNARESAALSVARARIALDRLAHAIAQPPPRDRPQPRRARRIALLVVGDLAREMLHALLRPVLGRREAAVLLEDVVGGVFDALRQGTLHAADPRRRTDCVV